MSRVITLLYIYINNLDVLIKLWTTTHLGVGTGDYGVVSTPKFENEWQFVV